MPLSLQSGRTAFQQSWKPSTTRILLGHAIRDLTTFSTWLVVFAAIFGLPMTAAQKAVYREFTGRTDYPKKPFRRALLLCGRRGGKSWAMALIGTYIACFRDFSQYIAPGEKGIVSIVAADRSQALVILRYISGFLQAPLLKDRVIRETAESFELKGNIIIEVQTCSFKALRGYTYVACLADEMSSWESGPTSANPSTEVVTAILPALKTIPNSLFLIGTTPLGRDTLVGDIWERHYGPKNDPVYLIWQADSRSMNPTLSAEDIALDIELDPERMTAEYTASFRQNQNSLFPYEKIECATDKGVFERQYDDCQTYTAALDASSGRAKDSFTLAIAHRDYETDKCILDVMIEARPEFEIEDVIKEMAAYILQYRCTQIFADNWSFVWVQREFARASNEAIQIEACGPGIDRSVIYSRVAPLFNSGRARLVDHARLQQQLASLVRFPGRGKDHIDALGGKSEDCANAACLALLKVTDRTAVDDWKFAGTPAGKARLEQVGLENQMRSGRQYLGGGFFG